MQAPAQREGARDRPLLCPFEGARRQGGESDCEQRSSGTFAPRYLEFSPTPTTESLACFRIQPLSLSPVVDPRGSMPGYDPPLATVGSSLNLER